MYQKNYEHRKEGLPDLSCIREQKAECARREKAQILEAVNYALVKTKKRGKTMRRFIHPRYQMS